MALKAIDGKPVMDAKRSIKLIITDGDVSAADRKRPEKCAVAMSCLRTTHAKEVRVHLGRVYVRNNDHNWQRYMTPKCLRSEIIAFDRGGSFAPGEFVLSAPSPTRQTGKRQGTPPKARSKVKQKQRAPRHIVTDVRTGPA